MWSVAAFGCIQRYACCSDTVKTVRNKNAEYLTLTDTKTVDQKAELDEEYKECKRNTKILTKEMHLRLKRCRKFKNSTG